MNDKQIQVVGAKLWKKCVIKMQWEVCIQSLQLVE